MKENIWFTFKARIQAHTRLEWLDLHSQLLLVWYAILGTVLSIVSVRYPQALGADTDIFAAILSVALLAVSLSLANRDFRGRALAMRTNYRGLQRLHAQIDKDNDATPEQLTCYHDLLARSENHRDIDDLIFRVRNSATLENRRPNPGEVVYAYIWLVSRIFVTVVLYGLPLLVAYLLK